MMTFARKLLVALATLASLCAQAQYESSSVNLPGGTEAFEPGFDLDGDGRNDLLVVFQRRILVFFQKENGAFSPAPDVEIGAGAPIPDSYAAITLGKLTGDHGMQLALIGPEGVDYLTMAQLHAQPTQPVEPRELMRRHFSITPGPNLQYLSSAVDFDGSGRTALVLPNSDQIEVYRPNGEGRYVSAGRAYMPQQTIQRTALRAEPSLLGSFFFGENSPQNIVQLLPRLDRWLGIQFAVEVSSEPFLVVDYNQDKRLDIITGSRVLYQNAQGGFVSQASGIYTQIATAYTFQKQRLVAAPNLVDINGDGILDTFSVQTNTAKMSPRTDVSIFLGKPDRTFNKEPDFVLRTRDFAYSEAIPIGDIDLDGAQDMALIHLDFQASSASSQLKAYLRNGLDGELCFYLWDKRRNRYPEAYSFKHPVLLSYEIYGARQLFQQQIVINQDMDGDGFPDLVMKSGAQQISIFKNQGARKGFSSKPMTTIPTPTRFSSLLVQDLNGDKKGDIIVSGYLDDQEDRIIYTFFMSK
ncbi:MAG: VCBS repeat-containing protein [bacterium]|nr:VCBS repeat-containing protein [Candidatus Sumerlaeota bacterium]